MSSQRAEQRPTGQSRQSDGHNEAAGKETRDIGLDMIKPRRTKTDEELR
jgi:hypothetical protein